MQGSTLSPETKNRLSAALDRISFGIARRLEIDLRALAAFRIALGLLVIGDLIKLSFDLTDFYTDYGVLPRTALYSDYSDPCTIHAITGEPWGIALIFVGTAVVALALIVGYRTRIATFVSWLLLLSLHARNPMILNGGDILFRMLLFWGIFLPLGERWSLDARRIDRDRTTVANAATMALLLQMILLYVTNAMHKSNGEMWMNGEAVVYIFSLEQFTVRLGPHLAGHYTLLRAFTYAWISLVILSPLLLLLTGYARALFATLFVGMHLGMMATMRLGPFPLIVVAGFIPFYQTAIWDLLSARASDLGLTDTLDGLWERLQTAWPDLPGPAAVALAAPAPAILDGDGPDLSEICERSRVVFTTILPYIFIVLVVLSNAQSVGYGAVPDRAEPVMDATGTEQSWRMFAPEPLQNDGWFVVPGELEDGTRADILQEEEELRWNGANRIDQMYPSHRWRKYLSNVRGASNENHRSYVANYLCESWNRNHDTKVESLTIWYVSQPSQPYENSEPTHEIHLQDYDCSGDLVQPTDQES
jgi:hypothetical protein